MVNPFLLDEEPSTEQVEFVFTVFGRICTLALFSYHYLLNLGQEIELMWCSPFNLASTLYFVIRYSPFVFLTYDLAIAESPLAINYSRACDRSLHFIDAIRLLVDFAVIAFLILQTSAIYNHSRYVLISLSFLGLWAFAMDIIQKIPDTCLLDPPDNRPLASAIDVGVEAAFPAVILILAFAKLLSVYKLRKVLLPESRGQKLSGIMILQTVRYALVCLFRIFNGFWYFLASTTVNIFLLPFLGPISCIFAINFLLALKDMDQKTDNTDTYHTAKSIIWTPVPAGFDCSFEVALSFGDCGSISEIQSLSLEIMEPSP